MKTKESLKGLFQGIALGVLLIFGTTFIVGFLYPDVCESGNCYESIAFWMTGIISLISILILIISEELKNEK